MEKQNLVDVDKVIEEIEKINCVDYGSMFSYEAHDAVRDVLRDVVGILESFPIANATKHGRWVMDSDPDDGDCRCSNCHICIDALHRRNHGLLKVLGYQLNTFYKFCPNCGATMDLKSSMELVYYSKKRCYAVLDGESLVSFDGKIFFGSRGEAIKELRGYNMKVSKFGIITRKITENK